MREKAVILSVSLDGTAMRVMQSGRASKAEVYVIALQARSASGETMHFYPRIALPAACNAAGILGTIPISSLFVKELTASPGFKMIMVNMDGAATNKAALRMLRTELQRYEQLIVAPVLCSAHSMNNAVKWGLGTFPYGPYLRTAHCFESTARPDAIIHVDRMLDGVPGRLPTWRVTRSFLCNYCNATESKLGGDRVQCARRL